MPDATRSQPPTLLEEVRTVLRLHHYSIHTERSSVEWIRRFARFHDMRSRADLCPAEPKIEAFLTDLAVQGNVAAVTQNQAMHALVFLYKRVLNHALEGRINTVRAAKKITVPVVMTQIGVREKRSSYMIGVGSSALCGAASACATLHGIVLSVNKKYDDFYCGKERDISPRLSLLTLFPLQ